jgi:hypothetical protein
MGEEDAGSSLHLEPPQDLEVGCMCTTEPGERPCKVMFIGFLPPPMPGGFWVGVMYDTKLGKNNGSLNGRQYFHCPVGHGSFVRPNRVRLLAPPPELPQGNEAGGNASTAAAAEPGAAHSSWPVRPVRPVRHGGRRAGSYSARPSRSPASARAAGELARRLRAAGSGLSVSEVMTVAQFEIFAQDEEGARVRLPREASVGVAIRGSASLANSQPLAIRTKLIDRGDGTLSESPWSGTCYAPATHLLGTC